MPKPPVFSGIQPDGPLHIGNYLGAIRNWVRGQDRYENIFCVVDLHALTTLQDPTALRDRVLETAATYLASGLKDTARVFLQSQVPAHTELAWIFDCFTPMGWLERMTQFKERSARAGGERVNAGLFVYPALMAADILLYDTQFVPVGDDQRQHIEYTRDLAQRLNQRFGELFVLPQPLIQEAGARIMGLDDPTAKMSKSVAATRPEHALLLLDPPDVIRKKLARAKTDSKSAVEFPAGPGVTNLLEIYRTLHDLNREAVEAEFTGKPYSALKAAVAESVVEALRPLQQRYRELRADPAMLEQRLERSLEHVAPKAEVKLRQVRQAVGLEATRRRSPSR